MRLFLTGLFIFVVGFPLLSWENDMTKQEVLENLLSSLLEHEIAESLAAQEDFYPELLEPSYKDLTTRSQRYPRVFPEQVIEENILSDLKDIIKNSKRSGFNDRNGWGAGYGK